MKICELCTYEKATTTVEYNHVKWTVCEECKAWAEKKINQCSSSGKGEESEEKMAL